MTFQKMARINATLFCLLIFCLLMIGMLSGCKSQPNVDMCILYTDTTPEEQVVFCQNMKTGVTKDITLKDAHKFIAVSPTDYENLRSWYKSGCQD
jgi:hypothetical protein